MCGVVGFYRKNTFGNELLTLKKMSSSISHRGPDQYGEYISESQNVYFAHQRLSIHDLSEAGSQPMHSHDGRYVIVFNGEIYNYKEIKEQLTREYQINWNGFSDTEVLIEFFSKYGLQKTLLRINGMFAFSIYDKLTNKLFLARDRFGEKPLYIYSSNEDFAFASEMKAIEKFTNRLSINSEAIEFQLQYSYIPAPLSIYNEVFKLEAGSFLEVSLNHFSKLSAHDSNKYWCPTLAAKELKKNKFSSINESLHEIENSLKYSIEKRMDCDVPFGAFLSGGIDSSCVVALMSEISSKKVNTFSIGFDDKNYNEANISKKIAKKLGTEHYELYAKPSDFFDIIPSLNDFYDEPFSDSSQLPTMLVSKFAREKVTVALSGDSGDELFAGYNRHRMAEQLSSSLTLVNQGLRRGISTAIKTLSSGTYSKISSCLNILTLGKVRISSLGDKAYKFARAFEAKDGYELYRILISTSPEILRKLPKEYLVSSETLFTDDEFSLSEKMMLQDTLSYMCHDILVKVDRASMIYSLESRIPFLDNHVFDTAWRTPIEHKLYKGESKYPLKNLVNKYIGEDISKLPKHGFGVPIAEWLRHDLREWAEQYLCDSALENNEHINPSEVKKIWNLHLSGRENRQYELWNFIILQQWLGRSK